MSIIIVIMIAVSLSMDAFSLSLAYGTYGISKKNISLLAFIVGIYHFFMPLIGMYVGNKIIHLLPVSTDVIIFIILSLIGIEMIIETFKQEYNIKKLNFIEMFTFGFAVSLDSFSLGLGLKAIYEYPLVSAFIFFIASTIFTYIGLKLGSKINISLGKISTIIGGIFLIIIGLLFLCKV